MGAVVNAGSASDCWVSVALIARALAAKVEAAEVAVATSKS
jgi:hypothetical protein